VLVFMFLSVCLSIHCLYTVYTMSIHCLYTVYTLAIQFLYTVYTLYLIPPFSFLCFPTPSQQAKRQVRLRIVVCCSSSKSSSLITHHSSLITHHSSLITHHSSLITHQLSSFHLSVYLFAPLSLSDSDHV
jgi:hypothetical protein